MEVSENKVVKMHYKGTLNDNSMFDSSEGKEPLEFVYGIGMIIPGLEKELAGLKAGDKKTIKVACADAYGEKNDQAVQEVPKDQFPQDIEVKEGMQLMAQGPQGAIPVKVAKINDETITVDFNHPLAGEDLTFDVEIVEVRDATPEELEHGHSHGPGGHPHEEAQPEEAQAEQQPEEDNKQQ